MRRGVLHWDQALHEVAAVCACGAPCSPMQRSDMPVTAQAWSAPASLLAAPSWRNTPLQRPPLRCVRRAGLRPLSARAFGSKRLLTRAHESELHCVSGIAQQRAHGVAQGRQEQHASAQPLSAGASCGARRRARRIQCRSSTRRGRASTAAPTMSACTSARSRTPLASGQTWPLASCGNGGRALLSARRLRRASWLASAEVLGEAV